MRKNQPRFDEMVVPTREQGVEFLPGAQAALGVLAMGEEEQELSVRGDRGLTHVQRLRTVTSEPELDLADAAVGELQHVVPGPVIAPRDEPPRRTAPPQADENHRLSR